MVRVGDNWRCPYCGFPQVISQSRKHNPWEELKVKGGKIGAAPRLGWEAIVCANNECCELSLRIFLGSLHSDAAGSVY